MSQGKLSTGSGERQYVAEYGDQGRDPILSNIQYTIRSKVDVNRWEVNIFAFVLWSSTCFQRIDLWKRLWELQQHNAHWAAVPSWTSLRMFATQCVKPVRSSANAVSHLLSMSIKQLRPFIQVSSGTFLDFSLDICVRVHHDLRIVMLTFSFASCFSNFLTSTRDALHSSVDVREQ